jgi:hypothetical protein
MQDRGCEIVVFFDSDEFAAKRGRAAVVEISVRPAGERPAAAVFSALVPLAPLYIQYARALTTFEPFEYVKKAEALRDLGSTRRGLPDEHYRVVAQHYASLVAEGEPYPVKAMARLHSVTQAAASRWIKEAKRRGYIEVA